VPFVDQETIRYLISFAGQGIGAVPVHNGYIEPLVALYHRSFYNTLESGIKSGILQMRRLVDHPGITFVDFTSFLTKNPKIFDNLNAPGDLINI